MYIVYTYLQSKIQYILIKLSYNTEDKYKANLGISSANISNYTYCILNILFIISNPTNRIKNIFRD